MRLIAKICGLAAMALSVLGTTASAGTIDEIRDRGVLRIPAILNEVPYFNKDPRTNEWQGFVIDMANDIAKTLDVKLEVVESSWANAILDVQSGKVIEFTDPQIEELQRLIAARLGYKLVDHRLELYAVPIAGKREGGGDA